MKLSNEEIARLVKALAADAASWAGVVGSSTFDADKARDRLECAKELTDRALAWLDHMDVDE